MTGGTGGDEIGGLFPLDDATADLPVGRGLAAFTDRTAAWRPLRIARGTTQTVKVGWSTRWGRGRRLVGLWAHAYTGAVTRTLDSAIAKLAKLPAEEQDRLGQWLLDELLDEERWAAEFSGSQGGLSRLADEARAEIANGTVTDLDPDKL
jgi:hypothetical protein